MEPISTRAARWTRGLLWAGAWGVTFSVGGCGSDSDLVPRATLASTVISETNDEFELVATAVDAKATE